jgi:hypothetical protein
MSVLAGGADAFDLLPAPTVAGMSYVEIRKWEMQPSWGFLLI